MNKKILEMYPKEYNGEKNYGEEEFENNTDEFDVLNRKLEIGNKCGNVYFQSDTKKFQLNCGLCNLTFKNFISFANHFLIQHLQEWNERNVKVKLESVDIIVEQEEQENNEKELHGSLNSENKKFVDIKEIFGGESLRSNEEKHSTKIVESLSSDMPFENEENLKADIEFLNTKNSNTFSGDTSISNDYSCDKSTKSFNSSAEFQQHQNESACANSNAVFIDHYKASDLVSESDEQNREYNLKSKKKLGSKGRIKFSKAELTCKTCGRELPNISSLIRHKTSHIEKSKRPFKCTVCSKGFNTVKHLEKHSKVHEEPRICECDLCFIKFNSVDSKNKHQRKHSLKYRHLVEKIGKKMAALQQIENGNSENLVLEISVPAGYWRCDICDKMFKNSYRSEDHKRFHNEVKEFICELCGKGMASQQLLNHHILVHKEERRFKCSKCGSCFFTSAHLNRHERTTCNSEKLFECEICHYRFTRKEHLTTHSLTHEKNRTKEYKCEYCNALYLTSNSLRVHKKKHMVTADFKCSLCPAVFTNKEAIKRHEKRHENKGAFKCEYCEKRFNDKDDVQQHVKRQHFRFGELKEKPFACIVCNKWFMKNSDLKEHLATHKS